MNTIDQTTISIGEICELANAVVEDFRNNRLHFGKPEDAQVVSCALGNLVGRLIDKGMQTQWQIETVGHKNGNGKVEATLRFRCPKKNVFAKLSATGTCSVCRRKHAAA